MNAGHQVTMDCGIAIMSTCSVWCGWETVLRGRNTPLYMPATVHTNGLTIITAKSFRKNMHELCVGVASLGCLCSYYNSPNFDCNNNRQCHLDVDRMSVWRI